MAQTDHPPGSALVIGASRALGLGMAAELLRRGWRVTATVRSAPSEQLAALLDQHPQELTIEHLDITEPEQIASLHERLAGAAFDLLYINAGTTNDDVPITEVSTDDFVNVMVTNALSPMRVLEGLRDLVPQTGTIAVMSSRQGSISMNERGGHEVYRASKSALNQLMRSYAARNSDDPRTVVLVHPGWVKTDLGGPGAQLEIGESVAGIVDMLQRHVGDGGLQFLDYQDNAVAW